MDVMELTTELKRSPRAAGRPAGATGAHVPPLLGGEGSLTGAAPVAPVCYRTIWTRCQTSGTSLRHQ